MKKTKTCPGCKKEVAWNAVTCSCSYDFTQEPCPGCDRRILVDADVCPHCGYNLILGKPAKQPKPPRKEQLPKVISEQRSSKADVKKNAVVRQGEAFIVVAALGVALTGAVIDFRELHFSGESTDEALLDWAEELRDAWRKLRGGFLSNHAIGHLAMNSRNETLRQNWRRIKDLLGGEDAPMYAYR